MRIKLESHRGDHYKWYLHECIFLSYKKKYQVTKNHNPIKSNNVFDLQNKMPQTTMFVDELNTVEEYQAPL